MNKDVPVKNTFESLPPGVCFPWEQKSKEFTEIKGDAEIIKSEWEKLDALAYVYLWWWVQR
ncbi:hypothetical protein [Geosporobacter ferrireducens]|uniref:Uncharacterized protein n=1 Tax=Geosporobacter ferrireducens TaxID=1424294 RepID=A0A1D8GL02_9FIRM|nr:hypothetical protein [Geosporobacter ferrireducens]AOT71578.1 hypothetical protein Gferi_19800 [Geosporobacter ferrireducens]MTI57894.1 hypothetical protein [Geosporobacter ferrireducens]